MNDEKIKLFREVLFLRNYANQTINTYIKTVNNFYIFSNNKKPSQNDLYNFAQGTDLSLIQKILGHKNIKTTLLYTQISKSQLSQIANPFDKF